MEEEMEKGLIRFINKNIYDIEVEKDIGHRFDLILLKDVIEHIPRQDIFINKLLDFLKPEARSFSPPSLVYALWGASAIVPKQNFV
jgi:2-polyprenyl-3-methyl-5-hydroxy-6-metoxy-1,4-benzoquinol methylase